MILKKLIIMTVIEIFVFVYLFILTLLDFLYVIVRKKYLMQRNKLLSAFKNCDADFLSDSADDFQSVFSA